MYVELWLDTLEWAVTLCSCARVQSLCLYVGRIVAVLFSDIVILIFFLFFKESLQFLPTLFISWFKDNRCSRYCTVHMFLLVCSLMYLVASVVNNLFIITSISFESLKFCFIGSFTFLEFSSCIIFYTRSSLHCCECFNLIAAFVITVTCPFIRTLFEEVLVIKLSSLL